MAHRLLASLALLAGLGLARPAYAQTDTATATADTPPPGPAGPQSAAPAAAAASPSSAEPPREIRGLSWTVLTGAVPDRGGIVHLEMGFSSLPRLSYHHSLGGGLSVGGALAFDYAGSRPGDAFDASVVIGVPVRWQAPLGGLDLGVRGMPGVRLPGMVGLDAALLLELGASLGFNVEHRVVAGPSLIMPIALGFGGASNLDWPILAGGFVEFHVVPALALTLEAQLGPHLSTGRGTELGLRSHLGVAYRL